MNLLAGREKSVYVREKGHNLSLSICTLIYCRVASYTSLSYSNLQHGSFLMGCRCRYYSARAALPFLSPVGNHLVAARAAVPHTPG